MLKKTTRVLLVFVRKIRTHKQFKGTIEEKKKTKVLLHPTSRTENQGSRQSWPLLDKLSTSGQKRKKGFKTPKKKNSASRMGLLIHLQMHKSSTLSLRTSLLATVCPQKSMNVCLISREFNIAHSALCIRNNASSNPKVLKCTEIWLVVNILT